MYYFSIEKDKDRTLEHRPDDLGHSEIWKIVFRSDFPDIPKDWWL